MILLLLYVHQIFHCSNGFLEGSLNFKSTSWVLNLLGPAVGVNFITIAFGFENIKSRNLKKKKKILV